MHREKHKEESAREKRARCQVKDNKKSRASAKRDRPFVFSFPKATASPSYRHSPQSKNASNQSKTPFLLTFPPTEVCQAGLPGAPRGL